MADAARMTTLRRQRGNIKASITIFTSKLDSWQADPAAGDSDMLQQCFESMQKAFDKFEGIQDELEELDENEMADRHPIQESYDLAAGRARKYIREATSSNGNESVKSHHSTNTNSSQPPQQSTSFRLPRLKIPTFNGDLSAWRTFYNVFRVTIHESQTLDPVEKFHYLVTHLSGEALDLVKGLVGTEGNYQVAFDLLSKRYNSERRHVFHHFNCLLDLPDLKHSSQLSSFVAQVHKNTQALAALKIPIDQYDSFLVANLFRKLSPYYLRRLDDHRGSETSYPKVEVILEFLEKECLAADDSQQAPKERKDTKIKALIASNPSTSRHQTPCSCCNGAHHLFHCASFKQKGIQDRRALIQKEKLCFNCMTSGHGASQCKNQGRCRFCDSAHHSLLCIKPRAITVNQNPQSTSKFNENESENKTSKQVVSDSGNGTVGLTAAACNNSQTPTVLLGSALIQVRGGDGRFHTLRAVIDSAASSSFISRASAQRIGLKYNKSTEPVSGIGGGQTTAGITGHTMCLIKPRHSDEPMLPTTTTIIKKIVDLPYACSSSDLRSHFSKLMLADENFDAGHEVEFLLGADVFPHVYTGEKIFGPPGIPAALASIFGWVITGKVGQKDNIAHTHTSLIVTDAMLRKFWESEEIPTPTQHEHPDEIAAEKMYQEQHYRLPNGKYVVPILMREDAPPLGDSRGLALHRLKGTERRLDKDPVLKSKYTDFLDEYEFLEHMNEVPSEYANQASYYIPHHCVTRQDGSTYKIRVVFDASQKTTSGASLNDCLYAGKKLQNDVFDVILRFRMQQKVFTSDISKMYRMISLRPQDRKYQHIFWPKHGQLTEFQLNTVTYGTRSAPFLALRTLQQLDKDEGHKYPMASRVVQNDIFVDDAATGECDTTSLLEKQRQVIEFFAAGGFELQKWASNCPEILDQVPPEHRITSLDLNDDTSTLKILGIHWMAQHDYFYYVCTNMPHKVTKRTVLSQIARIFDPLGLIAPVVFKMKSMMQKLWVEGLQWDDPLPDTLKNEWIQCYSKLPSIGDLQINRCVTTGNSTHNSLIGFSDASKLGYAACVYLRSQAQDLTTVSLLAAKSRVAPTKTVSIPRLELCGAQLLSSLMMHIKTQLNDDVTVQQIIAFTDSTVVLSWIKTLPCQLKMYEANRVTHILDRIEPSSWRYIPSELNPSDIGSRGCFADELQDHPLWWTGPQWLADPIETWPTFVAKSNPKIVLVTMNHSFLEQLILKYSSFSKLQRVTAWLLRFANNLSQVKENRVQLPSLSLRELDQSLVHLVKYVQNKHFSDELQILKKTSKFPKRLKHLQPFLDQHGVLRVGGRLRNSNLPYQSKHPILLPKHDHFVHLLIDAYHLRYLHAGPRLLQSLLARKFWILAARSVIRSRLSKCVICFHVKPTNATQLMGDLPPSRVRPSKAFLESATDFGGPFMIREHKRRNPKLVKAYVCLFICLTTKAVHLELVSDLSTEAFLAALDRFVSRRGLCKKLVSDNATNYTGAQRHLSELFKFLLANKQEIDEKLSTKGIEWSFLPPNAPNFGGVHEAGIKTAKYHLKRTIGEQHLTFEEFTTVLTKIEAIMNSRPLCQLSPDAAEIDVLTPGHFLVGGPLVAVPEYDFEETPSNRLSRWQLLQKVTQQFWRQWSRDYLHTLIQRSKWQQRQENLKVGTVVLIGDDNSAPLHWKKGVIEAVHPGKDKVVRVVSVKTKTGTLKRAASKVYPLPTQ